MSDVEKLLRAMEIVSKGLNDNIIEKASNEELIQYSILINELKATLKAVINEEDIIEEDEEDEEDDDF